MFRCSRCGHFLYSPFGQKTRHCPFCTKIVKIDPKAVHLAENDESARNMVKQYNAGENLKRFLELRKRNGKEITPIFLNASEVNEQEKRNKQQKRIQRFRDRQLLLKILNKYAMEPKSLKELEIIFSDNSLDIDWVHEELSQMVQEKQITLPRPWEIQYIGPPLKLSPQSRVKRPIQRVPKAEIKRMMIQFFRSATQSVSIEDIQKNFSFFERTDTLEEILGQLLQQGIIYEPRSGIYSWTGEK